jgi:CRP-like cAMP-binding protein
MGDDVVSALERTPLGEELAAGDLERLDRAGRVVEAPAGRILRREGEPGGSLMVVLAGAVEVVKGDGRPGGRVLAELAAGAVVGEVGLLCGRPATATARTCQPSRLFELPRQAFDAMVAGGDPAALRLALALARVLASRLARMNEDALRFCEEYAAELDLAGVGRGSPRVQDLAAFRSQLSELNF